MNSTRPAVKDTSARESQCAYCGSDAFPMHGKDIHVLGPRAWRLAVACVDAKACTQRARARDAHMDERYALTEAGRAALAFILAGEQLHLAAAS